MLTKNDLLKNSFFYNVYHNDTSIYEEMILYLLIADEEITVPFKSKLHTLKYLKENCFSMLRETKDFLDVLHHLNLIDNDFNATEYLYYIDDIKELKNIVDNDIDINLYLRIKKVKKINNELALK